MAYKVEIANTAERDIEDILLDILAVSPGRAKSWFSGLRAKIGTLRAFPARCALAPENVHFGEEIRHLLYGRKPSEYRILYTISEPDLVVILHVRHGARDVLMP